MTLKEMFVSQVTGGRYFLTIIGGTVFAYCAMKQIIKPEVTATILTMIFISYFQRDRTQEPKINGQPEVKPEEKKA